VTGGNGGLGSAFVTRRARARTAVVYEEPRAGGRRRQRTEMHIRSTHAFACDITDDAAVKG
jgi:NAD(P)-dependent dehydrogenase (short-subunit alcohol dehydrogenase family)